MKIFIQGFLLYSCAALMSFAFVNCAESVHKREVASQVVEFQDYAKCFKGVLCGDGKADACYSPDTYKKLPEDPEILCIKDGVILEDIENE